jgi:hypothetical protein
MLGAEGIPKIASASCGKKEDFMIPSFHVLDFSSMRCITCVKDELGGHGERMEL